MKKFLFVLLLAFAGIPAFALYIIKGQVVDANTQSPIDFVNVVLYKANSETPAVGVSTDTNGNFILPKVQDGRYTLKISFIGYNPVALPLNIDGKELNMGVIKLVENNKMLKEVQVLGQGTQMKFEIDKKVFSVDQNIASAGGSATEVLQNIPSVDVDNEGNVSLRNNANVEVWINGKPSGLTADNRAQILQQMPAESIDNIEIMTNPSAKFSPEGTAGIINIVLKKNRKAGYFGSLTGGLSYADGTEKPVANLGVNINYSSGKVDAYFNAGYRAMKFMSKGETERYNFSGNDTLSFLDQNTNRVRSRGGIFIRTGADFHLNDKNTLSINGFTMQGGGGTDATTKNILTDFSSGTFRSFVRDITEDGDRQSYNISLDHRYEFDKKGSNIFTSVSYSRNNTEGTQAYQQTSYSNPALTGIGAKTQDVTQSADDASDEIIAKSDFTRKISDKTKLEAGWQSSFLMRKSPSSAYDNMTGKEIEAYYNQFNYNEQNHALYATYGTQIAPKLAFQGGIRAEYLDRWSEYSFKDKEDAWKTVTEKVDYEPQFRLFPSAYITYSLPRNNELQLNYTSRVNRPRDRQIDPFRDYSDSTNISYGNVNLTPEYSSSVEFNYLKSWDEHSLSASAYYRYTDQVIQRVSFMNNGTMESTFMNLTKSSSTGLELVAKNRLFRILNLTSSLNFYYEQMDSAVYKNPYDNTVQTTIPAQDNFSWGGKVMANIMFGRTTFGQITADYSAPHVIAQGKESASYAIDLGLRQTFFNKMLTLNLMVRDLLNSRSRNTTTWGEGFYQKSNSSFRGRMFGITATYNFGNVKPKPSDKKKPDQPDMMMDE
jgi:outer membrane receptor protein involved in Fe transport